MVALQRKIEIRYLDLDNDTFLKANLLSKGSSTKTIGKENRLAEREDFGSLSKEESRTNIHEVITMTMETI